MSLIIWGLKVCSIEVKENTGACQMAKQHPSVMPRNLGLRGLQNTMLLLPNAFLPSAFPE